MNISFMIDPLSSLFCIVREKLQIWRPFRTRKSSQEDTIFKKPSRKSWRIYCFGPENRFGRRKWSSLMKPVLQRKLGFRVFSEMGVLRVGTSADFDYRIYGSYKKLFQIFWNKPRILSETIKSYSIPLSQSPTWKGARSKKVYFDLEWPSMTPRTFHRWPMIIKPVMTHRPWPVKNVYSLFKTCFKFVCL